MKTEKLYESDSDLVRFSAKVLLCEEGKRGYDIVLDKTAFFPEGGGQAFDEGLLGGRKILHVREKDGVIYHVADGPLTVGEVVEGEISWDKRFPRMQNHAAEHILSGFAAGEFGCTNVGFHLNDEGFTVDFDKPLGAEEISLLEKKSNEAIWKNEEIRAWYPTPEELSSLDYRAKLDLCEGVRLVRMGEADLCACCAPHPARTGEIGSLKVIDHISYKGGVRLTCKAGSLAFEDHLALREEEKKLMHLYSAKRGQVFAAAEKEHAELFSLRNLLADMKKKLVLSQMETHKAGSATVAFLSEAGFDEMRECANALGEKGEALRLVFSRLEGENWIWVAAASEGAENRAAVKILQESFSAKGGGKPDWAQGKLTAPSKEAILGALQTV